MCVHSRRPRPPSAQRYHPPGHVPPAWFLTTSAVFSAHKVAGLLHPAASHGVRPVSHDIRRAGPKTTVPSTALPESQAHTLRRVPLCCSRAASLRPLHLMPLAARRIAVKLRSAEADPHVTPSPRARTDATVRSCARLPSPEGLGQPPKRPESRTEPSMLLPPLARSPLPGVAVSVVVAEHPTSGLFSTTESVVDRPPFPTISRSFLPWACVPFEARRASLQAVNGAPARRLGPACHDGDSPCWAAGIPLPVPGEPHPKPKRSVLTIPADGVCPKCVVCVVAAEAEPR
jgi:hypothetical protein